MQFYHHVRQRQDHDGAVNRRHQCTDRRHTKRDPLIFDVSARLRSRGLNDLVFIFRIGTLLKLESDSCIARACQA
jgi:hypothetical protein